MTTVTSNIKICTVDGCTTERRKRQDGTYVNGFCVEHHRADSRSNDKLKGRASVRLFGPASGIKPHQSKWGALPNEVKKAELDKQREIDAANGIETTETKSTINPYADLPDTLPEQDRTERVKDEEYNKHPAYMYLLQTDPIHFPTTLNCGVTTRKPSSRLGNYRRCLDYNHPFADTLDFWCLARVPNNGKVVEAILHGMMSEHGPRHGRREEWTIEDSQKAIDGFRRIINKFGGEIIADNTKLEEVA